MSASSWLVTCGIVTQLRDNAGPEILRCATSPRARSVRTCEIHDRPCRQVEAKAGPCRSSRHRGRTCLADMTPFTCSRTSRRDAPWLRCRARESGRPRVRAANLRTDGDAWGFAPGDGQGRSAVAARHLGRERGDFGNSDWSAVVLPGPPRGLRPRRPRLPPCQSAVRPGCLATTLSPIFTRSSLTTPAADEGISIDALVALDGESATAPS